MAQDLPCDATSSTTTSAGLDSFLDSITTGGASASAPRVVCLTASTITLTSQVTWTVPDHVVLIGTGSLSTQGGGGSGTNFVDNYAGTNPAVVFTSIDGYFRFAGFTYTVTSSTGSVRENGIVQFGGDSTQTRIDHFTYNATGASDQNKWMNIGGCLRGVMDHAVFNLPNDLAWIHFVNGSCDGDTQGNVPWSQATNFGSGDFFYIEDSQWNNDGSSGTSLGTVLDCHTGGKHVIRFNTVRGATIGQTHSTIHGADDRGCRAHEIYGNDIDLHTPGDDPSFALSKVDSGGALYWGNTYANNSLERGIQLDNCRIDNHCGYTPTAEPNNWGPCGTGWSGTPSNWDRNDDATGYACVDQAGRGAGDLISGTFPAKVNTVSGTRAWPHQVLEPIYEWLNTGTPTGSHFQVFDGPFVQNRDYYLYRGNTNCNAGAGSCTAGVGAGTLAQRPEECTTGSESGGGVAYWATDQGSWNESTSNPEGVQQNGADGVLYKCTATNTWTVAYTPYTYPHPLQAASAGVPFLGEVTGLSLSGDTTPAFLSEPTGVGLTGDTTPAFLSEPTGVDVTGETTPTFLGEPTGLSLSQP